ncbi:hypothetical protein F2Q70_00013115 [Brassica cretica]|uniref:Anaphase-promoting complex subunit 4 WD40 domain-containing protein n=1 Tax=Brassica cretica TaxID=69181 RepID=A0A8S9M8Q5_BRACR|nr:hypothetical protein F2Q70_00013115 [Brassica cretica]
MLLATGSMDKTVKLWDLSDNKPSCIASHIPNAGALCTSSSSSGSAATPLTLHKIRRSNFFRLLNPKPQFKPIVLVSLSLSISWIPKGSLKPVPDAAEPPSKEEIKELIESGAFTASVDEASNSKKASSTMEVDDVAAGMKELDMDNYDEEDDGIELFSSGRGDLYYPISWIPKGSLKPVPDAAEPPSKEEIKELIESGAFTASVDEASNSKKASSTMEVDDVAAGMKELDMDNYDEEDDGIELFSSGRGDLYYPSNELDPYLKDAADDDDDEDDIDDTTIKSTDSVIICARNEDEVSHLEVYVYEESSDGSPNMYVHHHIIIPEFPLCTAWIDCPLKGGDKGNFVSIGSKETPTIEIWDLDVRDEVLPCVQLGGVEEMEIIKKKKSKKQKYKEGSHTDSVLGLAWNKEFRNILASGSADNKVKVWDVATGTCKITMEHHTKEKDGRQPSHSGFKWSVMSDVESLAWDPHCEHSFVVSLEDGTVKGFDIRTAQSGSDSDLKPSFTIQAHDQDKGVSSISYNISV